MADAREKKVLSRLADLAGRTNYVVDNVSNLREPLGRGDIIEIPSIADLTVESDGGATASIQSVTTNVLSLQANNHPAIFAELPAEESYQNMDGAWADQVAQQAMLQLKNNMDSTLVEYLIKTLGYDASATYHNNVAADALTASDLTGTIASLMELGGVIESNLAFFMHPFAVASMQSISGWQPNGTEAANGDLGIRRVGTVYGIPVFQTSSCLRRRTVASNNIALTSNVLTITVDAGHGIVPGQKITFDTDTAAADITSATAVTSVTATTIVVPLTASDISSTAEVGAITVESTESVLADVSQVFVAQQVMPSTRIVPYTDRTSDALQVSSLWGYVGRQGRVRVLNSPPTL